MQSSQNYGVAALNWLTFGFSVIPLIPGTKKTAVKWDAWLDNLSPEKIAAHWVLHPDHEVGCIVGDELIVFDADSPMSKAALAQIEDAFGITPNFVVKTSKGVHHYYRRAAGAYAKSDAHSTEEHPECLDIKTGRAMVVLPPSTGKEIEYLEAGSASELTEIGQDVIDAIFRHNGRDAPRAASATAADRENLVPSTAQMAKIKALVECIHRYGYRDWLTVLMAIHHETGGSQEGLELADYWSSKGRGYKGRADVEAKWKSFSGYQGAPYTISTLCQMVSQEGGDWLEICAAFEPQFELCESINIDPPEAASTDEVKAGNPLDKYSLRGMGDEISKSVVEQVHVLGEVAIKGQATAFYAAPNTGKTLITLNLLVEAIRAGRVNSSRVYYINVDDTVQGLSEKQAIADEYGFHMIAEGWRGFAVDAFLGELITMTEDGSASGVIIILDTLKKFTNLMDKGKSSNFAKFVRRFVLKGGTLIALAHTNKNPGADGKPKYAGTSDIVDDFDCAYTLRVVGQPDETGEKVVEFENFKRRGNVAPTASYSYSPKRGISYPQLVLSVAKVDDDKLLAIKQAEQVYSDAVVIQHILAAIGEGINTKMKLAFAVGERAGISRNAALQVIERYTGDDPAKHWWNFNVEGHGAKVFTILDRSGQESGNTGN